MRWLLSILLLLASVNAQAFGQSGHQLICDIAYQLVKDSTRQQLDKLISQTPYPHFNSSCSWPDEVRSEPEYRFASVLHFVNFPKNKTAVSPEDCPADGCIFSGITQMQQRLKNDKTDWQALLFLAHFIGDLHQPLHVSFADDLGGNRTAVYFFGLPNNLHGVWDFAMLKQLGYEADGQQAETLRQNISSEQKQHWRQGDVLSWANESARITVSIYQDYTPGMLIDESYVQRYQPILEQRLQQGAVRLAMLLDQLFGLN